MEVKRDFINNEFYVEQKIGNQTFRMSFQHVDESLDTIYFNIALAVYNKRKHMDLNEQLIKSTGKSPFATIITAIKAFEMLEKECREAFPLYDVYYYACWLDSRRKSVYEKFLIPRGYSYGKNPFGEYCLFKKYKRRDDNDYCD